MDTEYDKLDALLTGQTAAEVKKQRELNALIQKTRDEEKKAEEEKHKLKLSLQESNTYFYAFATKELEKIREAQHNTYLVYSQGVKTFVDFAGNVKLIEITPEMIKGYIARLEKTVKANTVATKVKALSVILKAAKELDLIELTPFEKKKIRAKKAVQADKKLPTWGELERIEAYVRAKLAPSLKRTHYFNMFMFACGTGLRFSDVLLLKWGRVSNGELDVMTQKTKTKKIFKLTPLARRILALYPAGKDNEHVFPFLKGVIIENEEAKIKEINRHNIIANLNLKYIHEACDVLTYKLHFHMSRAFFATDFLRRGGNIVYLQQILGHANITQTQQYLRLIDVDVNREIERLYG